VVDVTTMLTTSRKGEQTTRNASPTLACLSDHIERL